MEATKFRSVQKCITGSVRATVAEKYRNFTVKEVSREGGDKRRAAMIAAHLELR